MFFLHTRAARTVNPLVSVFVETGPSGDGSVRSELVFTLVRNEADVPDSASDRC